ncbi:MAG: hypothetical protein GF308_10650 [Candidatus Heimdallarchaeota archaeon]|nr:hypothetical protein [Candidatus Heimdallarchaeota archaeon]
MSSDPRRHSHIRSSDINRSEEESKTRVQSEKNLSGVVISAIVICLLVWLVLTILFFIM